MQTESRDESETLTTAPVRYRTAHTVGRRIQYRITQRNRRVSLVIITLSLTIVAGLH